MAQVLFFMSQSPIGTNKTLKNEPCDWEFEEFQSPIGTNKTKKEKFYTTFLLTWFQSPIGTNKTVYLSLLSLTGWASQSPIGTNKTYSLYLA